MVKRHYTCDCGFEGQIGTNHGCKKNIDIPKTLRDMGDNKPKTDVQRKREQRAREKANGYKPINFMARTGTIRCIEDLCQERGLVARDRVPELITNLIHEEHKKRFCEMSQE